MQSQIFPFRPSLGMIELIQVITPHSFEAGDDSYEVDDAFLKASHRRQVIRKARLDEFDVFDCMRKCVLMGWPYPPQLWVMVIRSGEENFIVIPIYLGKEPRWPVNTSTIDRFDMCENDGAFQLILDDIMHNKGFDHFELIEWNRKVHEVLRSSAEQNSPGN